MEIKLWVTLKGRVPNNALTVQFNIATSLFNTNLAQNLSLDAHAGYQLKSMTTIFMKLTITFDP